MKRKLKNWKKKYFSSLEKAFHEKTFCVENFYLSPKLNVSRKLNNDPDYGYIICSQILQRYA